VAELRKSDGRWNISQSESKLGVKVTEEALSLAIAYWRAGDTTRAHLFDHTHSIFIDATLRLDVRCRDRL
jgi:hypothetical protein